MFKADSFTTKPMHLRELRLWSQVFLYGCQLLHGPCCHLICFCCFGRHSGKQNQRDTKSDLCMTGQSGNKSSRGASSCYQVYYLPRPKLNNCNAGNHGSDQPVATFKTTWREQLPLPSFRGRPQVTGCDWVIWLSIPTYVAREPDRRACKTALA